jgi:hypothetical protein
MKILHVNTLDKKTEMLLKSSGIPFHRCKTIPNLSAFAQGVRVLTQITNTIRTLSDEEEVLVFVYKAVDPNALTPEESNLLDDIKNTLKREYLEGVEIETLW